MSPRTRSGRCEPTQARRATRRRSIRTGYIDESAACPAPTSTTSRNGAPTPRCPHKRTVIGRSRSALAKTAVPYESQSRKQPLRQNVREIAAKTTMLGAAIEVATAQGCATRVVTPTKKAADVAAQELGVSRQRGEARPRARLAADRGRTGPEHDAPGLSR